MPPSLTHVLLRCVRSHIAVSFNFFVGAFDVTTHGACAAAARHLLSLTSSSPVASLAIGTNPLMIRLTCAAACPDVTFTLLDVTRWRATQPVLLVWVGALPPLMFFDGVPGRW